MSCPNCKIFHSKCKAECCGIVPIPNQVYQSNKDKLQREVIEEMPHGEGVIIPLTADATCPFLKQDYSCAIYEQRPDVCKKFGDETHILMTCVHQTKGGAPRNMLGQSMLKKKLIKHMDKRFGV